MALRLHRKALPQLEQQLAAQGGMPPGAGFVTKWYLILAMLETGKYLLVGVVFISTLLMIIYFWRVVEIIFVRTAPEVAKGQIIVEEAPSSMLIPCATLGILAFAVGIAWMSGILTPLLNAVNAAFGLGVR